MSTEEERAMINKQVNEYRDWLEELYYDYEKERKEFNKSEFEFKPKLLEAKFIDIDSFGKASVSFSRDIKLVPDLKFINNGTIYLDEVEFLDYMPRRLNVSNENWYDREDKEDKDRVPILQVKVIPGKDQDIENI